MLGLDAAFPRLTGIPAGYVLCLVFASVVLPRWAGWTLCGVAVAVGVASPIFRQGFVDGFPLGVLVGLNRSVVFGLPVLLVQRLTASRSLEYELSRKDPLTGLANRRLYLERLEAEVNRSRRTGEPLSLVFLDCDGFKAINDSFGHFAGDRVLKTIAATLTECVRNYDLAARWGGDEFLLLLPGTGAGDVKSAVERVACKLDVAIRSQAWELTFSMGIVTAVAPRESAEELLLKSDAAMYQAKHSPEKAVYEVVPELQSYAG